MRLADMRGSEALRTGLYAATEPAVKKPAPAATEKVPGDTPTTKGTSPAGAGTTPNPAVPLAAPAGKKPFMDDNQVKMNAMARLHGFRHMGGGMYQHPEGHMLSINKQGWQTNDGQSSPDWEDLKQHLARDLGLMNTVQMQQQAQQNPMGTGGPSQKQVSQGGQQARQVGNGFQKGFMGR